MSLMLQTMQGRRARTLLKRRVPGKTAGAKFAPSLGNVDGGFAVPETRNLVGDAEQGMAEAAIFGYGVWGPYPGLPANVRNAVEFKAALLDLPTENAAKNQIINGPPPPKVKTLSKRTVTSGEWLRWERPPEQGGGVLYRLNTPSGSFFPKFLDAIDVTPGGKAAVLGSLLFDYLTGQFPKVADKVFGTTFFDTGGAVGKAVGTAATGGQGVKASDAANTLGAVAVQGGTMVLGATLGAISAPPNETPASEVMGGESDPPVDEPKSSPVVPIGIGLLIAKFAGFL